MHTRSMGALVLALLLFCLATFSLQAATIYVTTSGNNASNGTSWASAKQTIQAAIDVTSPGDQIWVAAGSYIGTINLKDSVSLYGGFAGTESSLNQRNIQANPTILDGNNAGSVITVSSGTGGPVNIDGFTIRKGRNSEGQGGGINATNSTLVIQNDTITSCFAMRGGGVALENCTATIENCRITANIAENIFVTSNSKGGGIYTLGGSCTIRGNQIIENIAKSGTSSYSSHGYTTYYGITGMGGGIYCDSTGVIVNNLLLRNKADSWGADNGTPEQHGYTGDSGSGGGIYCKNCTVANNTIVQNQAPSVVFSTLLAPSRGGGIYCSTATITNNIFYGNTTGIYRESSSTVVTNNCLFKNYEGNFNTPIGTASIYDDPQFVNSAVDDYHLTCNSPCIDAGEDSTIQPYTTDLDNKLRIQGQHADLGAYESSFALYNVKWLPSETGCSIAWTSLAPSTSRVEYGLTSSLGSLTPNQSDLVVSHQVNISSLAPQTTYYFRVRSIDAKQQESLSDIYSFTTSPNTPPDTIITTPVDRYTDIYPFSLVTIEWVGTDNLGPGQLTYSYCLDNGAWSSYSTVKMVTFTSYSTGIHTFKVKAKDATGLEDPTPAVYTFVYQPGPPEILDVVTTPSETGCVITWKTNKLVYDHLFYYGETVQYKNSAPITTSGLSYSVTLDNLKAGQQYYFAINCRDRLVQVDNYAGTFVTSSDRIAPDTEITGGPSEGSSVPLPITFTWTGHDQTTSTDQLTYSYRLDNGTWSDFSSATTATFTDLTETQHLFEVRAKDKAANIDPTPARRNFIIPITPFTIVFYTPGSNVVVKGGDVAIDLVFNHVLAQSALNSSTFTLKDPDGIVVPGQFTVYGNGLKAAYTTEAGLTKPGNYTVWLSKNISSATGDFLGNDFSWTFRCEPISSRIYVNQYASGTTEDGLTWNTAFKTVQQGLRASLQDSEVWVRAGGYSGTAVLKNAVSLYGGFKGTENFLSERNWMENQTVIRGWYGYECAVAIFNCSSTKTRVDGFTIENSTEGDFGGGIRCEYSSPSIENNVIRNNRAMYGGGIYIESSTNFLIKSNIIQSNTCYTNSCAVAYGGGIYCSSSSGSIAYNQILNNSTIYAGPDSHYSADGGGLYSTKSSLLVVGNQFSNNTATNYGGGIYITSPGPSNDIYSNNIIGNQSKTGAGIACYSHMNLIGNTIAANQASVEAGGVYINYTDSSITNNLSNNIIANNSSGIAASTPQGTVSLKKNCFYANQSNNYSGCNPGTGDISVDPQFVNSANGDYHLKSTSPCIDLGDDSVVLTDWLDIDGQRRIYGAHVDMGADEVRTLETYTSPVGFVKAKRWNLISLPAEPINPDPLVVFNGIDILNASFQYWDNSAPFFTLHPFIRYYPLTDGWVGPVQRGVPYWLLETTAVADKTIQYVGYSSDTLRITIPARQAYTSNAPFWIMFGAPYTTKFSCDLVHFTDPDAGGSSKTWSQATALKMVESKAIGFNAATQSYFTAGPTGTAADTTDLQPWCGYWLLVDRPDALLIEF